MEVDIDAPVDIETDMDLIKTMTKGPPQRF